MSSLPTPTDLYTRRDFEFQHKIGDGAFAQVWQVRHRQSSKPFAIKQVQKSKIQRILPQFQREVSILYQLSHPNILKLISHFEDEKFFYLILELVEGGNLFQKLSKEQILSERLSAQYFKELLLAVEYLHTRTPAIVHRDIKPENVLIDKTGKVKLVDFGWANFVDRAVGRKTVCGTLEYLPPEMVEEKSYDTCADVWCLGVLLYEMLTGTTPFKASGKEKTMKNILSQEVKFPLGFSHIAKDLILKMLERNGSKRIDVFQVKKHRWLSIMEPAREPIVRELVFNALEDVGKLDEVKTTYSESDVDEEWKAAQESEYRKSVKQLRGLQEVQKKEKNSGEGIGILDRRVKELGEEIERKREEIVRSVLGAKECLKKCFELNSELEVLERIDQGMNKQTRDLHKRYVDLEKEVKLQQGYLEDLKTQVKSNTDTYQDHKETLETLQVHLQDLRDSLVPNKSLSRYSIDEIDLKIHEFKLNTDLLKSKIKEKNKILHRVSLSDRRLGKEFSGFVETKVQNSKDLNRSLAKKLEEIEEAANEKEQKIIELRIEFETKKSQNFQEFMNKKEEFFRRVRTNSEDFKAACIKKVEIERRELKMSLYQACKIEFHVQKAQIDAVNDRMKVKSKQNLKRMLDRLEKMKKRKESQHRIDADYIQLNKIKILETQAQVKCLKSQILTQNLSDCENCAKQV